MRDLLLAVIAFVALAGGLFVGLLTIVGGSHAGPPGQTNFVNLSCGVASTQGSTTSVREATLVNNDADGSIWVDFQGAATADANSLELKVGDSIGVAVANLNEIRCIAVTAAKDLSITYVTP